MRIRVSNTVDSRAESFQLGGPGLRPPDLRAKASMFTCRLEIAAWSACRGLAGSTSGKIRLQGDAAAFDNDLAVAAPQPIKATVAHFGRSVEEAPRGPLFFSSGRWPPPERISWRSICCRRLRRRHPGDAALAIVTESLKETAAKALGDWLAHGGRAVVVLREAAMADTLGRLVGQPLPGRHREKRRFLRHSRPDFVRGPRSSSRLPIRGSAISQKSAFGNTARWKSAG